MSSKTSSNLVVGSCVLGKLAHTGYFEQVRIVLGAFVELLKKFSILCQEIDTRVFETFKTKIRFLFFQNRRDFSVLFQENSEVVGKLQSNDSSFVSLARLKKVWKQ